MSQSTTAWPEGRESGRHVVVLGIAVALTLVALDLVLVGRLSLFFDLSFIALSLALAFVVRRDDFFTVGVLPPLIMVAVFTLLAIVARDSIANADDGFVQALVTGLATHSAALAAGYALCLATLAFRQRQSR